MNKIGFFSGGGAVGTAFFSNIAEAGSSLPGCTGVCGTCGGTCILALAALGWLGAAAWYQKKKKGATSHG